MSIGPLSRFMDATKEKKCPLIVKMTIDEQTAMRLISQKPNTLSMAGFCAMLVEYGLQSWGEQEMRMKLARAAWGDEAVSEALNEKRQ